VPVCACVCVYVCGVRCLGASCLPASHLLLLENAASWPLLRRKARNLPACPPGRSGSSKTPIAAATCANGQEWQVHVPCDEGGVRPHHPLSLDPAQRVKHPIVVRFPHSRSRRPSPPAIGRAVLMISSRVTAGSTTFSARRTRNTARPDWRFVIPHTASLRGISCSQRNTTTM